MIDLGDLIVVEGYSEFRFLPASRTFIIFHFHSEKYSGQLFCLAFLICC